MLHILFILVILTMLSLVASLFKQNPFKNISRLNKVFSDENDPEFDEIITFTMNRCESLFGVPRPELGFRDLTNLPEHGSCAGLYVFNEEKIYLDKSKFVGHTPISLLSTIVHEYQHHVDNVNYCITYTKKEMDNQWSEFLEIFEFNARHAEKQYSSDLYVEYLKQ